MGKYRVNVTFGLAASVEPDGYLSGLDGAEGVSEVDEDTLWSAETVVIDGGDVWVTVEAEDEAAAGQLAVELFQEHARWNGYDNLDWEFENVEAYEVEAVEEPMDLAKAIAAIEAWLDGEVQAGRLDAETRRALDFLLALAKVQLAAHDGVTV